MVDSVFLYSEITNQFTFNPVRHRDEEFYLKKFGVLLEITKTFEDPKYIQYASNEIFMLKLYYSTQYITTYITR